MPHTEIFRESFKYGHIQYYRIVFLLSFSLKCMVIIQQGLLNQLPLYKLT